MESRQPKLKICIVASYAPSLLNFRGDLIKLLLAQGYDVTCLAPDISGDIKITLAEMGAKAVSYPLERNGLNPVRDLKTLLALRKCLANEKADIIMPYTIKPVIFGTLAAKLAGVKHRVALITGLGYAFVTDENGKTPMLKKAIQTLYRFGLTFAHKVIVQNPDDLELLVDKKITSRDKLSVVNGSGVNMNHFHRTALPEPTAIKFLLVARLYGAKGVYDYVKAAYALKRRFSNVEFHLVGGTDHTPDSVSDEELKHWSDDGVITYHGQVKDVRPMLNNCHVFVLPSAYREGTPRSVLEAMSTGRPIITTDSPGCRETVIEGQNGYLIMPRDSDALTEKMASFVEDPDSISEMGEHAHQLAKAKFDVNIVNQMMLSFLQLPDEVNA